MRDIAQTSSGLFQVELFPELPKASPSPIKINSKNHRNAESLSDERIQEMVPDKTPDAFKTISEAAVILALPQYVLRFWESKFKQIKPLKMRGGRRYYRPEDIEVLQTIKHLLYKEGYTIKGAKKAFEDMKKSKPKDAPVVSRKKAAKRPAPLLQPTRPAEPKVDASALAKQAARKQDLANLREELRALKAQLVGV